MIWDIVIAVAAALCQLLTAILGFRITMNPLDPKDPKQRKKRILYNVLFLSAGILGVFFVGLAAYRMPRERAHLGFKTDTTYHGSSGTSSWASGTGERRAEFLLVNSPLAFNLWYTNLGPGVALNITNRSGLYIEPDQSSSSQSLALAQFEKSVEPPKGAGITLAKGDSAFLTAHGAILSPEDYDNLVYGRRVEYLIVEFSYHDDAGSHVRQLCQSLLPPQEGGFLIWGSCESFNGEY
jgi:hypothetical protein